jgi:PAS domain S-box-containing protein
MMLWNKYKSLVQLNVDAGNLRPSSLVDWRNKLFVNIAIYFLPLSLIAILPAIIQWLNDGDIAYIIYDIVAILFSSFLVLKQKINIIWRKRMLLSCLYLLCTLLLIRLGLNGIVLMYFYTITIVSTLIFPISTGYLTIAINACIVFIFTLVQFGANQVISTALFNYSSWAIISVNLLLLSILIVSSINLLFKGLYSSHVKENKLRKSLQTSEMFYKQLFDKNPLPMFIYDSKTFRFLLVNQEAVNTYGYTEQEFLSMSIFDIRPGEDALRLKEALGDSKNEGYRKWGTWQHILKNGNRIEVNVQSDDIQFGKSKGRIVTVTNVTERNAAARLLEEQTILLKTIARNFPSGTVAVVDTDYTIEYIDGQELATIDKTSEELIKTNYLDQFAKEEREAMKAFLEPVFAGSTGITEMEIGGQVYLRSAVLVKSENHNSKIVITSQNVTEQRLKEKSLNIFEAAIINSKGGVVIYNPPAGIDELPTIAYANAAFEEISGYHLRDLIGKPAIILNSPNVDIEKVNRLKEAVALQRECRVELKGVRANGEQYWTDIHLIPMMNKSGKLVNYVALHNDITLQKNLEAELISLLNHLSHSEKNLWSLINNTNELIWSVDENLNYIVYNEAVIRMANAFGSDVFKGEFVIPRSFDITTTATWKNYYNIALSGEKFSTDIELNFPGGIRYVGNLNLNPIVNDNGKIVGIVCSLREITQRRVYEEKIERQNDRLKEIAFLTSHSLRAPLTNIIGLVRILDLDDFNNPQNKDLITYIHTSAMEVDRVVHEIVDQTLLFGGKELSMNFRNGTSSKTAG